MSMNQYEIDYQQGYDACNDKWIDKLEQIKNRLEKMPFYFGTTFHGQTIKTVDVEKVIEMLDEAIKEQTNDRDN